MIIEKKKLSELKPAPYNPRQSTAKQEKHLKASLEKFGVVEPIIYNKQTGYIVGGHFRVRELTKLGYKEVECVIVDLNEEDERELNIRLNANTGEWDWDSLANEWDAEKLDDWGLDLRLDLSVEELEAEEDDFDVPEGGIETDIVLGDLFEIGEHRLLCGDSTDSDQVSKLMNGQKADMVFTDPPYGVSASGGRSQTVERDNIKKIENDNLRGNELKQFISDALSIMPIKESGSFYVCYDQKTQVEFISAIKENNWNFKRTLIWNKNVFGLSGKKGYRPKYELIAFGCIGEDYKWFGDNAQADVIDVARPREREGNHPTPKPIELIEVALKNSSEVGNLITDSFLGSGSTMVASHQLKRKCYGMELDPKYCQVIIDRMKKLDQSLVIKKNGVEIK
jgi:DNA modification methylase